jgi:N-acetylglucosamine kinase-like BadF-type ATPase
MDAAEAGDTIADHIIHDAAGELASATAAAARQLNLGATFPVALAGGLIISSPGYRARFLSALTDRGLNVAPVALVTEPAEGAVRLALDRIASPA